MPSMVTALTARSEELPPENDDDDDDDDLIDEDPSDEDEEADAPEERVVEQLAPTVVRRTSASKVKARATRRAAEREQQQIEEKTMARKRNSTEPANKTLSEIPREEILGLEVAGHNQVRLDIKRQLPNGQWGSVKGNIILPPRALFDLEPVVRELAGGSTYVFDVTDMNTRAPVIPRWREIYDGRPHEAPKDRTIAWSEHNGRLEIVSQGASMGFYDPVPNAQSAVSPIQAALTGGIPAQVPPALAQGPQPQYDQRGQLIAPPPSTVPSWMHHYPPTVQWQHVMDQRMQTLESQQRGGGAAAGGGAMQWVHHEIREQGELKSRVASLSTELAATQHAMQEKIEALQREAQARIEEANRERVRAEKELERTRSDAQYAELKAQMAAMTAAPRGPSIDWAALVAGVAPLVVAWVNSGNETQRAERAEQTKLILASMTRKEPEPKPTFSPEMVTAIAGLGVPLLTKWMESSGPQASAELMQLEHEQRMMHLKMVADMMVSSMPEPPPIWQPIVEQMINMVGSAGMALANKQLPRTPQGLPSGAPTQAPTQAPASTAQSDMIAQMQESDPEAAADVQNIFARLPPGLGFHTHEWMVILFNVHSRLEVDELTEIMVAHLSNCARFGMMPTPLHNVFEEPEAALRVVLTPLPIHAKDPEYVDALIDALSAAIRELEVEEEDGAVVTPPPTADARA